MGAERRERGMGGRREREIGVRACDSMSAGSSEGLGIWAELTGSSRPGGRGLSPNCLPGRAGGVITPRRASQLSQMCITWTLSCCCPAGTCVEKIQESVHSGNQARSIPSSALKHQINEGC